MNCINCNSKIPCTARFCGNCGMEQDVQKNLILGALESDQDAYTALYGLAEHAVKLTVYAILCPDGGNHADADDVILESMVKGFKNLDQLKNPDSYLPWMKAIARNKAIDYLRKNRALNFSEIGDDDFDFEETLVDKDESRRPELVMDKNTKAGLLQEILTGLPQEQRTVLVMYYYHDMKISEIASELGCSEATVKSRLKYGKAKVESGVNELQKKHGIKLYTVAPVVFFYWLFRDSESAYACGNEIFSKVLMQSGVSAAQYPAANVQSNGRQGDGAQGAGGPAASGKIAAAGGKAASSGSAATVNGILIKAVAVVAALAIVGGGAAYAVHNNRIANRNNAQIVAEEKAVDESSEDIDTTEDASTQETEAVEVEHPEYAAYADILNDSSHEEFSILDDLPYDTTGDDDRMLSGLCFAKLVDMDGNGVDELILVDGDGENFTMQIWSYEDGEAQQLYEGMSLYYYREGACVRLLKRGDYYYVETGYESDSYDLTILGYENGVFGTVVRIETADDYETYYVNGESMDQLGAHSYFEAWPDYIEYYRFIHNINYIKTTEEEATDYSCAIYSTNDPDELQQMVEDVKAACNAKAEEVTR